MVQGGGGSHRDPHAKVIGDPPAEYFVGDRVGGGRGEGWGVCAGAKNDSAGDTGGAVARVQAGVWTPGAVIENPIVLVASHWCGSF